MNQHRKENNINGEIRINLIGEWLGRGAFFREGADGPKF